MIDQIEAALIAKLSPVLPKFQVAAFPDKPEHYSLTGLEGAVLIRYLGSVYQTGQEFGPTSLQSLEEVPGARVLSFELALLTRGLGQHQGVYPLLQQVLEQLTGFAPAGASELLPVKDGFMSYAQGIWCHFIHFTTTVP
ncbi:MAG: hypothetical protein A2508_07895 [Candidatus Lambdaproteobacteria bacterium RIFOXYD12_FULL_49_8]|uniref:Uncharacterized protein n=1 Tax=Candidatus Lambdaproteobacteria bacterium RIFOXYD2_FULL_50_16 TaxID=1817772 RepID=A0A1F6G646_9PROT|nr:MAG: hypothetical protein A2527_11820 [Candidatus Lambdaproteobacteria bacterium RIFOXYD2_FULL_50_16]OGG97746.1 MAG: hypothetical protein A2508_07895 [Candidatus Lambdaproteobacteria bacterium RIFOXYD12_FULL_49_8]